MRHAAVEGDVAEDRGDLGPPVPRPAWRWAVARMASRRAAALLVPSSVGSVADAARRPPPACRGPSQPEDQADRRQRYPQVARTSPAAWVILVAISPPLDAQCRSLPVREPLITLPIIRLMRVVSLSETFPEFPDGDCEESAQSGEARQIWFPAGFGGLRSWVLGLGC